MESTFLWSVLSSYSQISAVTCIFSFSERRLRLSSTLLPAQDCSIFTVSTALEFVEHIGASKVFQGPSRIDRYLTCRLSCNCVKPTAIVCVLLFVPCIEYFEQEGVAQGGLGHRPVLRYGRQQSSLNVEHLGI